MSDVMLDLETMGNGPNAAIIAIGAVVFDIDAVVLKQGFYQTIDLASSVACGGIIDASTVLWWMQQDDAARKEFAEKGAHVSEALNEFSEWLKFLDDKENIRMWGNGAAFDNVILASAYRRNSLETPWMFWNDRCYRTVRALHPDVDMVRTGTYHNALDDAKNQATHLIAMLRPTKP